MFDTDLYAEIRRAHSQPLRPRSVAGLEARIRTLANERLDVLLPQGSFDLTQEYGGIVSASMVCGLLGLPDDLAPQVLAAVNAGSLTQPGEGVDTGQARPNYLEYLIPVVQRRRADSSGAALPVVDGLLGYRLPDGSALSDVEVATQMLCIFIGGTETVPKIVAHGLWELSQRPDQMTAVCADPATNVSVAREEMIRYCAPAQWFARTARRPYTIHGQTIEPGQRIITLLASANRDEREYPQPDEFVWNRPIPRSLAFGRGQHFCIGYHLARLEIDVLLAEWLRRVPDFAIRGDAATPAAVQLPVGLEQHPGGGLTCGPTGSSPPICSSGPRSLTKPPTTWPMATCCCGSWRPGFAGSDLPAFRGAQGRLPGDDGPSARREGRVPDPRSRRRGDRQPASRASSRRSEWW